MNVLFLDVDGVLNSQKFLNKLYEKLKRTLKQEEFFDPECMKILKEIVDTYDLKIVITSSWKMAQMDILTNVFKTYGLTILDKTQNYGDRRGEEIRDWLKEHKDVEDFVILDDDFFSDYIGLEQNLVQTSFENGLQKIHKEQISKIMNKNTQ